MTSSSIGFPMAGLPPITSILSHVPSETSPLGIFNPACSSGIPLGVIGVGKLGILAPDGGNGSRGLGLGGFPNVSEGCLSGNLAGEGL